MKPHTYEFLGLDIHSDIEFPGISEAPSHCQQPDLALRLMVTAQSPFFAPSNRLVPLLVQRDDDGRPFLSAYRLGACIRFHYHDMAEFVLEPDRRTISMYCSPDTSHELLYHLFSGPVCSTFLARRGRPTLHATAVVIDGSAVAFVAPSGSGKSTLAAHFVRAGHALVSDDLLLLDITDTEVRTLPSFCQLRLWPDVVEEVWGARNGVSPVYPGAHKVKVATDHLITCNERRLLWAICFLECGENRLPEMMPLPKRRILLELVASVYGSIEMTTAMLCEEFTKLSAVARLVSGYRLSIPRDLDRLAEVYKTIIVHLRDTPESA